MTETERAAIRRAAAMAPSDAEVELVARAIKDAAFASDALTWLEMGRISIASLRAADREAGLVTVPLADYRRLVEATETDDMIVRCDTCGAWLDSDDPGTALTDDYTGCWKLAMENGDPATCRSYRVIEAAK